MSDNSLKLEKIKKYEALKELKLNGFSHNYKPNFRAQDLFDKYSHLKEGEVLEKDKVVLAGRLMTFRKMGKASFFHLQDSSGKIQAYIRPGELSEDSQNFFKNLDIGDIVGIKGYIFKTRKGELSVHCENFCILCKSIEILPEKFHGLTDVEVRYRQRHLDLIMSPEKKEVFKKRSLIIKEIRNYLDSEGFLEVETPILQPHYGGAHAEPFETHHNSLDMRLYMKISPELYLKRIIVGGFDKIYDLGRNFRNEGIDRTHNPEFTMLEYYEAYTDYKDQMKRVEELFCHVIKSIKNQKLCFSYQGRMLDFTPPWKRLTLKEAIKEYGGFCVDDMTDEDLFHKIKSLGSEMKNPLSKGEMMVEAFELCAESQIWNPTIIYDFPVEVSPLTKTHRDDPVLVERFEPIVAGMELGNSYTELNDPIEQRKKLENQKRWTGTSKETQVVDEDFLKALEMGMPPTGGVGIGVERLVMLLTDSASIRDILFFPTMKPK